MDNENILISAASDLYTLCERRGCPVFSHFYDGGQQALLKERFMIRSQALLFGGNEKCERKILGVFPEWEEPSAGIFPIRLLNLKCSYTSSFSHRDYLGSLMGLGIERDRIGDIVVGEDGGYVFVYETVFPYIMENLKKIGSHGIKINEVQISSFLYPEGKYIIINTVSASMRIDAVLAGILNISRNKSALMVEKEKININHKLITDASFRVQKGDLISARGFGRFEVNDILGETRSGRLHISIKKYL